MGQGYYAVTKPRRVVEANYNTYVIGTLHPDRIMKMHDLIYMLEGTWEIWQNDSAYILQPDDVLILHAGEHHYGKLPCSNHAKTMYIHVNKETEDTYEDSAKRKKQFLPTLINCRNHPQIKRYFAECIKLSHVTDTMKEEKRNLIFALLLCELYTAWQEGNAADESIACKSYNTNKAGNTGKSGITERAVELLQASPERFLSAQEISKLLFVCPRTLNNKFNLQFHKTFYRYQMDLKLEMAAAFLHNFTDVKLYEVARNFGFYDEFHFNKLFQKKYGISPGKFRDSRI